MTAPTLPPPAAVPGLRFVAVPPAPEPSPLRSDVAGFMGRTRRGPVGVAQRVEGWREYQRLFGGLDAAADTTYALRGYFANGGQVAWVVRLLGAAETAEQTAQLTAKSQPWVVGPTSVVGGVLTWDAGAPADAGFVAARYIVEATSPGAWANETIVSLRYSRGVPPAEPAVDVAVEVPGEPPEYITGVPPSALHDPAAVASRFIRFVPMPAWMSPQGGMPPAGPGPRSLSWVVRLSSGTSPAPLRQQYLDGAVRLSDTPEVALVAAPDVYRDLVEADAMRVLRVLVDDAARLNDRLVVVDLPSPDAGVPALVPHLQGLIALTAPGAATEPTDAGAYPWSAAAVYHPWLRVPDPFAAPGVTLREVPPSGHVAGVISRIDRERGAHHTPANAELLDAVDISRSFDMAEQATLFDARANLLRCVRGRGLQVWGGRTLDPDLSRRFVAHRRLIHRLVRAIRRVAEPLVFDINGPTMWLALVRGVTTVLLAAWRGGGLKGSRPEEAFWVQCDETLNPPEERDLGRVVCRIALAPAVPMEFIELRVALSAEGRLEVFES